MIPKDTSHSHYVAPDDNDDDDIIPTPLPPTSPSTPKYTSSISIDQSNEKLDGEVVQYKITIHNDTWFNIKMNITYQIVHTGPIAYLFYLTNGTKVITLHISDEAVGRFYDITTFRKHRKFGGNLRFYPKKGDTGSTSSFDTLNVKSNDTWYLTMAVAKSGIESMSISFETKKECMEISQILRNDKVSIASAINADFKDGNNIFERYWGFSVFGFGWSHCIVTKLIPVTQGGIICADMFNYRKGMLEVRSSFGYFQQNHDPKNASILFSCNNASLIKYWYVYAKAIGFPRKTSILAFVVDVPPYSKYNDYRESNGN